MAKNKDQSQEPQQQTPDASHMLPIQIHRQYIRDLSFENPGAPQSLMLKETPSMNVEIDVQARQIEDDSIPFLYEVLLRLQVETTLEDKQVFILELDYSTLASIGEDVPEDKHHPTLFIEIPRHAFPFANHIITTTCQEGGFPPIYLRPVDFHSLYLERFKDEIEKAGQQETS